MAATEIPQPPKGFWQKVKAALLQNNKAIWAALWATEIRRAFSQGEKVAANLAIESVPSMADDIAKQLLSPGKRAQAYYEAHGMEFVKTLTDTDIERLKPILADNFTLHEDAFAQAYEDSVSGDGRLETIKRTESRRAENTGMDSFAKDAGAKTKTWHANLDERTRDSHVEIDGETVDIDEVFSNGCSFPGDGTGAPEEVINCRCYLTYGFASNESEESVDESEGD